LNDNNNQQLAEFVQWFRQSSPYIHAFRGRTFVIAFGGEVLADAQFPNLVHDLALLNSLGVRLVLVHGARPQIEERLSRRGAEFHYVNGLRVTDELALACVKDAAGSVRVEIEALLSMGLSHSPRERVSIRVASGNFVTAQPLGVREGVDYLHTGEVRRVEATTVHRHLDQGDIVLLSPMGYSPTGEVFNLSAEDVATASAIQLKADKLIFLFDECCLRDAKGGMLRELTELEAEQHLHATTHLDDIQRSLLRGAIKASRCGVARVHFIDRHLDGGLLMELFTRDGVGTLISAHNFEDTRSATIDDIGGILELIAPLEAEGMLVKRSRELLEIEIQHFTVVERDGMIVACAALYPFPEESVAELACLAVHPDYRGQGRGDSLFNYLLRQAREMNIQRLFVLTTRTAHWFQERGFMPAKIDDLPVAKKAMYNYQRNSKVFIKKLD
jgi:amino-acid N-acetyltransferase